MSASGSAGPKTKPVPPARVGIGIDDGVGQAAAGTHDRRRAVAHGDELALAARLEARRHQEEIGARVDAAGLVTIEAIQHRDPVWVPLR